VLKYFVTAKINVVVQVDVEVKETAIEENGTAFAVEEAARRVIDRGLNIPGEWVSAVQDIHITHQKLRGGI
jgi:hypothetical protein